MARRRKAFRDLSPRAQARATRIAENRYNMLAGELERRYDAGVYNPFARGNPMMRIPEEYREYAEETESGEIRVDWREAAYESMHRLDELPDVKEYNDQTVQFHVRLASDKVRQVMAWMTTDEIRSIARIQGPPPDDADGDDAGLTHGLTFADIEYYSHSLGDTDEWHNIFWYH